MISIGNYGFITKILRENELSYLFFFLDIQEYIKRKLSYSLVTVEILRNYK